MLTFVFETQKSLGLFLIVTCATRTSEYLICQPERECESSPVRCLTEIVASVPMHSDVPVNEPAGNSDGAGDGDGDYDDDAAKINGAHLGAG